MEYELPQNLKITKKEEKEMEKKINKYAKYFKRGLATGVIILIILIIWSWLR